MTDPSPQDERLRKLQERRASSVPASSTKSNRRQRAIVITRAVTGGASVVAFVSISAALGPLFAAADEVETAAAEAQPAPAWVAPGGPSTIPTPTTTLAAAAPPPDPLPPTTIIIQVSREYLVPNPNSPADTGSRSLGSVTPAPPAAGPAPTAAPAAPQVPTATAAPAPPPPPPPPPPPTTRSPLTGGS